MILTTHAIAGATVATLVPSHPVLGFALGFSSHFLLDAIPHWSYKLSSMKGDDKNPLNKDMVINKDFLKDLLKVGTDGIMGLLISYIILGVSNQHSIFIICLGAIAGMLPDALQFFYFKWRHEPLVSLQKFHIWIHSKICLDEKPLIGISSQILIILIIIFLPKIWLFFM